MTTQGHELTQEEYLRDKALYDRLLAEEDRLVAAEVEWVRKVMAEERELAAAAWDGVRAEWTGSGFNLV